jgi:hypothetical protein
VEDQHLRAAEQRGVEFERRVFGGGTHQRHRPILDIRQEAVLLRAIEAVDLVDEEQRALAQPGMVTRLGENLLEVGDARENRRDRRKAQPDGLGEQPRDRGFAGARRPPEDHGRQPARRDHPTNRALRAGEMVLADHLIQRARAQPVGERGVSGRKRFGGSGRIEPGEQVGHGADVGACSRSVISHFKIYRKAS